MSNKLGDEKMNTIELAKTLIQIPSESGQEQKIGRILVERLKKNFDVRTQPVGDRFNVLATKGKPQLILTTHIDTVPKQLEIKEDKEWLYGRGACDTKGLMAAMICAAEQAVQEGITNFGLLFDVGEETDFAGVKKATTLVNPNYVIVGEPTAFTMRIGQKGLLGFKLSCKGVSAPGATPEKGISAIERLIDNLERIRKIPLPNDEKLGESKLNIGMIQGGSAVNVVPDYAEATVEVRTTESNKTFLKKIRNELRFADIEITCNFDSVLLQDLKWTEAFNLNPTISKGFNELYFWSQKSKAIVFGPGDYAYAHGDQEKIRKKDILKGQKIYLDMIRRLTKENTYKLTQTR
ncbi:MAG: M20/M25/M40 family metallo-hydrolase [Nanoarchaeota archaeon]